jgi:hypothetical protein
MPDGYRSGIMQEYLSQLIVTEARTWIGTGFAHQGRLRKTDTHSGGVDCLGLLIGIADALRLRDKQGLMIARQDRRDYTRCPDGEHLRAALADALMPVTRLAMGTIALFSLEGNPQHVGIISDYHGGGYGLVHAYAPARKVVEHALDTCWQRRITALFCMPATVNIPWPPLRATV